jgi:plasmid stabilization system protein ParE
MPKLTVIFSPRAKREIDAALRWWREHRGTPALDDAIAAGLDRLEAFPEIGAPVKKLGRWSPTRRYILDGGVGYHLYYDFELGSGTVEVICFWHERRRPPRL